MFELVRPDGPIEADVLRVPKGRPATSDGLGEHHRHRIGHTRTAPSIDRIHRSIRPETGAVANLVAVDVPDTSDDRLVEEHRLETAASIEKRCADVPLVDTVDERIGPKPRNLGNESVECSGGAYDHLTEGSRVHESQLATIIERGRHVAVHRPGDIGRHEQQLSAHPKMDHHDRTRVEADEQILPAPVDPLDSGSGETSDDCVRRCAARHSITADLDDVDPPPDDLSGQRSTHGLHLRELGHRSVSGVVESRKGGVGGGLLGDLLRTPRTDSEHVESTAHLNIEPLVVIRTAGDRRIRGGGTAIGCESFLKRRLSVECTKALRRCVEVWPDQSLDRLERGHSATVEVDRAEHGLECVGQNRVSLPAPSQILATTEQKVLAKANPPSDSGERNSVHDTLAEIGKGPFAEIRKAIEGQVGDHPAKNGVTEKLESFIRI
jgi:hypothetical protein